MGTRKDVKRPDWLPLASRGIVTLVNWTLMPDGQIYLYVWAPRMQILTDPEIARIIPGFRSAEHWTLALFNGHGQTVALIPGSQVKAWVAADHAPSFPQCFNCEKLVLTEIRDSGREPE